MTHLLILLVTLLSLAAPQQISPRLKSRSPGAVPTIRINFPTTQVTSTVSSASFTIGGTCVDDDVCTEVTWTCATCTPTLGTADLNTTRPTALWSDTMLLSCSGPGTANTIVVNGSDGLLPSLARTHVVTCITPDAGSPTVNITSASGTVTTAAYLLTGTCTDDVACDRVEVECDPCALTPQEATLTGNGSNFELLLSLTEGLNTIDVTAYDALDNTDVDQITVTYDPPLTIADTTLPVCVVGSLCTLPALQVSGETGAVSWARTGGDAFPDDFAINASSGVISGTCSGTSTSTPIITATDSEAPTPETDTEDFVIRCQVAGSETAHMFFDYQTDNRSACVNINSTNCIIRFNGPRGNDVCSADNGGCSLRSQSQLYALGVENQTAVASLSNVFGRRYWNYLFGAGDTGPDPQDGVRMVFSGEEYAECGDVTKPLEGFGCQAPVNGEHIQFRFPFDVDRGVLVLTWDMYLGAEFKSDGTDSGAGGDCGGDSGNHKRWKFTRVDARQPGGLVWWPLKVDMEQDDKDRWFYTGGNDNGLWDCSDNVVGMVSMGATKGGEDTASADSLVAPSAIGVADPDSALLPGGYGTAFNENTQTYPIKAATWTRVVAVLRFGVPANSAYLAPWRANCDQSVSPNPYRIETSSVNAGTDTTLTIAQNHNIQAGDTVFIWGHEGSVPDIGGYHTVSSTTSTTITIPVDVTTAGHDGAISKSTTTARDTLCANMLDLIKAQDPECETEGAANCSSLWNVFYQFIIDENRKVQRTAYAFPWHTMVQGTRHSIYEWKFHVDSSKPSCIHCGNRFMYLRNAMAILNPDDEDIADDGCTLNGRPHPCGDLGATPALATRPTNLLRKPVR